jgi:ATP synthase protein I
MSGRDDHDPLARLGRDINRLKQEGVENNKENQSSAIGQAMQMGVEFLAGVGVGCVLGYFLDRWLDTSPIFLMVGLALGSAAGYRNLVRSLKQSEGKSDT